MGNRPLAPLPAWVRCPLSALTPVTWPLPCGQDGATGRGQTCPEKQVCPPADTRWSPSPHLCLSKTVLMPPAQAPGDLVKGPSPTPQPPSRAGRISPPAGRGCGCRFSGMPRPCLPSDGGGFSAGATSAVAGGRDISPGPARPRPLMPTPRWWAGLAGVASSPPGGTSSAVRLSPCPGTHPLCAGAPDVPAVLSSAVSHPRPAHTSWPLPSGSLHLGRLSTPLPLGTPGPEPPAVIPCADSPILASPLTFRVGEAATIPNRLPISDSCQPSPQICRGAPSQCPGPHAATAAPHVPAGPTLCQTSGLSLLKDLSSRMAFLAPPLMPHLPFPSPMPLPTWGGEQTPSRDRAVPSHLMAEITMVNRRLQGGWWLWLPR